MRDSSRRRDAPPTDPGGSCVGSPIGVSPSCCDMTRAPRRVARCEPRRRERSPPERPCRGCPVCSPHYSSWSPLLSSYYNSFCVSWSTFGRYGTYLCVYALVTGARRLRCCCWYQPPAEPVDSEALFTPIVTTRARPPAAASPRVRLAHKHGGRGVRPEGAQEVRAIGASPRARCDADSPIPKPPSFFSGATSRATFPPLPR